MEKCINCGSSNAKFTHVDGGKICEKCIGEYFVCPDCGLAFDRDDRDRGDQSSGFCKECSPNH